MIHCGPFQPYPICDFVILQYCDPYGREAFLARKCFYLVLLALMHNLFVLENYKLNLGCTEGICLSALWPCTSHLETLPGHTKSTIRGESIDIFHHLSSPSNGFSIAWSWY